MVKNAKMLGLFCGIAVLALAVEPVPLKIYIEPQNGFESYISAAIVKKQTPVVVTRNKADAQFMLTGSVTSKDESTGSKIARCLFIYCIGMEGTQTATVQLVNIETQKVAWAYNVRKASANAYQSTAEAIAKHLKGFLKKNPVFASAVPFQQTQAATRAQKEVAPTTAVPANQAAPPYSAQPVVAPVTAPPIPSAGGLVLITFASNPPGALVSFSGMGVCYTPCVTKLELIRYKVRMTLAGYADWTGEITVEAGKPATVVGELQRQ